MKKGISLLLALCFLFALLPAVGLNASAGGGTSMTIFYEDFEDELSIYDRWNFSDLDGDANGWIPTIGYFTETDLNGTGHYLVSASYINEGAEAYFGGVSGTSGPQNPDNLASTPQIELPAGYSAMLSFDVFAVDAEYAAEKFTVYYSCGEYDYVLHSERLDSSAGDPKTIVVDMSEYAGTEGYIVFRHHETTDEFMIGLDNVRVLATEEEQELPDFIEINYTPESVETPLHQNVTLQANFQLPVGTEGVSMQWYVADAPDTWGMPIEGACEDTLSVPTDEEGTLYYHCYVLCKVGDIYISTQTVPLKEVKVTVAGNGIPSMFFDDVSIDDWFYHDVEFVYYSRLMGGTGENTFSPYLSTTRGMIVTILYRLEGEPEVAGTCPFTDVAPGSYYEDAIIWAARNDIVNGMGDGIFAPDENITREQLAAIFCRYAKFKGIYNEDDCTMLAGFKDQDAVSSWAVESVSWAVGVGLIGGSNEADGVYLMPQGNALRCQAAAILNRFYNNLLVS